MKNGRTGVFLGLILVVAVFLSAPTGQFRLFLQNGAGLLAGRNVNMVSGQKLPYGDPFLQRQNEPSIAVSTRNPMHLLAGANDYRTVDMLIPYEELPGPPEGAAPGRDAWLGVYKSFNGGQDWQSGLLYGFPQDATAAGVASPLKAYGTAADPVVRAGTNGLFYMSGIAFNRNAQGGGLFIARFIDNNNKEKGDTIKYLGAAVLDKCTPGQFIDKPWLAVDLPRSGATVDIDGQTIPAHNVYVAYTVFLGNTDVNVRSKVLLARSTNCGLSWGPAVKLSETQHVNQGVTIAVDPRNNGVLYVAWRRFTHSGDPDAIIVCRSADGGQTFTKPVVITTLTSFDQGSTPISFRTNSYPSLAVDHNGLVYAVWSQRPAGLASGTAKVFMSASGDGATWSPPTAVDADSAGHQVMPSLTYATGRVVCVWYDQRRDISGRFGQWIDDTPGEIRHTLDVRAVEIAPGSTSNPGSTIQVSRYLWTMAKHSKTSVQAQYSRPNYPLFKEGTRAFYGDYIDLTPSPMFIPTLDGGWVYNMSTGQTPVFHAAWTDNRDVRPPGDNDWSHYTPPTSEQDDDFKSEVGCQSGRTSIRNQNVYTASLTGGLVVGSPGNHKSLGPNPYNQAIKHTFVVYVKNLTSSARSFRLTIKAPDNVDASFLQDSEKLSLDVTVAPASSIARTVFASSTSDPDASIQVLVKEISGPGEGEVTNGLNGSVILNPDIENPDIENPDIENPDIENPDIENYEVHNPDIENPDIENPDIENPEVVNPDIENPDIENPDLVNPDIENPDIENPDIENRNVSNPDIENPDIENPEIENGTVSDYTWRVKNIGNTASSYKFHLIAAGFEASSYPGFGFQLLMYRVYYSPVADNCTLERQQHDELLANIVSPDLLNPDIENPDIENPDIENPDIENATFWLAPGDEACLTLRVYDPNKYDNVTFDPAVTPIAGVATAQGVNSQDEIAGNMVPPVSSPLSNPVIYNTSLPNGIVNTSYTAYLVALYGKPPYTWTILSGALPAGLSLVANTGAITGTPTGVGVSTFTVQVADSNSPARTATATFTISVQLTVSYTLTTSIEPAGLGTITKNPDKPSYSPGETVQLTANGLLTHEFGFWTGSLFSSTNPETIVMSGNRTVTANFVKRPEWANRYNGPGNYIDNLMAMTEDAAGNIYVTGVEQNSLSGFDCVTIKYNSSGAQLWVAKYTGSGSGTDNGYAIGFNGGYLYVAGLTEGQQGGYHNYDLLLLKYDPSTGAKVWVAKYDHGDYDSGEKIAFDGAGNIYVTGLSRAVNTAYDYLTVKYSSSGTLQWASRYSGPGADDDRFADIKVDSTGVYVTGYVIIAGGHTDWATVKYDLNSGAQLWAVIYSGTAGASDHPSEMALDSSGNVYVTGQSRDTGTGTRCTTVKYNGSGTQLWVQRYAGQASPWGDYGVSIATDATAVYVAGMEMNPTIPNSRNCLIIKYDLAGTFLWSRVHDMALDDIPCKIVVDGSDVYMLGDSTTTGQKADFAIVKYNSAGTLQNIMIHNGPANDDDHAVALIVDSSSIYAGGYVAASVTPLNQNFAVAKFDKGTFSVGWIQMYNGSGNRDDEALAVTPTASGDIYVTGRSVGPLFGKGPCYYLANWKYTSAGTGLWMNRYPAETVSTQSFQPVEMAMDSSGNAYIAGFTGTDYIVLFKYDGSGTKLWDQSYIDPSYWMCRATSLALDTSGNAYVAGYVLVPGQGYDFLVLKYDSAGNLLWARRWDGAGHDDDRAFDIAVNGSGVYVTGQSYGGASNFDMATIKFDFNGNVIWVSTTGGSATGDDRGLKLTLDPMGNVCVTGRSYSDTTLSYDIHTLKLNSSTGAPIWSMRYSGSNFFNEPKAIATDAAGNVYVTGRSDINGGATPLSDYVTIKYDAAAGTQLWAARYDGPNHDQDVAYGLAVDSTGNVYVTGESDGIGTAFDIATVKYTSGGAVVWVARYNGPAYFNDFARALAIRETGGQTEVYVVGGSHGPGTDVDYIVLKYK